MAIKIGLDAGHGLKTSGKQTPDGIKEWTLNDKVRDKVVAILKDYDVEIIHTDNNEGNTDETLASRLSKYKAAGVKAYVSIHHNAYTSKWNDATGVEVFTDNNPTAQDSRLAKCIYDRLVKYTGLKGRGIKKCDFYVINQDTIPAVLVEGGFMDGRSDYNYITSDVGQTAYAKAVAEGLIEFLGLEKKSTTTTTTKPTTTVKPTTTTKPVATTKPTTTKPVTATGDIAAGTKLTLKNISLYASSSVAKKSSSKTGTYYVWSKDVVNNRIRITNSKANVGKSGQVTGWINYADAKKSVSTTTSSTTATSKPATKSLDDWAKEVINGKHGNGMLKRTVSLKKAGCPYSYAKVQSRVNALLKKK